MKLLTVAETAERLGYCKETVRRLIAVGVIPALRLPSGRLRVAEDELQRMVTPVAIDERE